eukprot:416896_1
MSDTVNNILLQRIQTQMKFEHIKSNSSEPPIPLIQFNDEFYEIINLEGQIDGPFNVSKVANIFVSHFRDHSLVEHRLWVRPCQKDSQWYKLNVSYLKITSDIELCLDSSFYTHCGNLHLIIEKLKKIGFYSTNSYPSELINNNESIFHIPTIMINYGLFIFSLLHIHILICFFYLIQTNESIQSKPKIVTGFCILLMFMAIITSFTISYLFIYFGIYSEYQSWMIAYISWISIQWIEEGIIRIMFVFGYLKTVCEYDAFRLNILGIQFKRKNDIMEASGWHNCWIPATFAFLPASIIGFVTNFIFEEEFVLECDADLLVGDICYDDRLGCCDVVSSHDFSNYDSMLDFLSTLASNIIAVYGLIRIFAWFMVSQTKQYKGMAQKVE